MSNDFVINTYFKCILLENGESISKVYFFVEYSFKINE